MRDASGVIGVGMVDLLKWAAIGTLAALISRVSESPREEGRRIWPGFSDRPGSRILLVVEGRSVWRRRRCVVDMSARACGVRVSGSLPSGNGLRYGRSSWLLSNDGPGRSSRSAINAGSGSSSMVLSATADRSGTTAMRVGGSAMLPGCGAIGSRRSSPANLRSISADRFRNSAGSIARILRSFHRFGYRGPIGPRNGSLRLSPRARNGPGQAPPTALSGRALGPSCGWGLAMIPAIRNGRDPPSARACPIRISDHNERTRPGRSSPDGRNNER